MMCEPDCDAQFIFDHHFDMFYDIRWVSPCWLVGTVVLTSTAASAVVILAVRNAPSVLLASSWSHSVHSMQTESARSALLSSYSMKAELMDINRACTL